MKQTADLLKEWDSNKAKFIKDFPNQISKFSHFLEAVKAPGALDRKTKELIGVALGINAHCEWCIAIHTKYALDLGATKEEIWEAGWAAVGMGGGPSLAYLQVVQKALEDLST